MREVLGGLAGQQRTRALEIGRSIDTEWNRVNASHGNLHAGFQRTKLFQTFPTFQRTDD
jgi:hypothetical protein